MREHGRTGALCALTAAAVLVPLMVAAAEHRAAVTAAAQAAVSAEEPTAYVALTFDDGPRPDTTAVLLEGLAQRGAKATFFLIGEQIEGNGWLIEWMAADGHQIGNHTFSHVKLEGSDNNTVLRIPLTEDKTYDVDTETGKVSGLF